MASKLRVKIRREDNPFGKDDTGGGGTNEAGQNNGVGGDFDHPDTEGIEGIDPEPTDATNRGSSTPELEFKPRRGRPPGSKNKTATQASVFEEPIKGGSNTSSKPKTKRKKLMSEDEATQITQTVLTVLEGFTVSLLGEEARLNDTEKLLLYSSVPKMLTTISESAVESASKIIYPATAIIAVGLYSLRLGNIYTSQKETSQTENFTNAQRAVNTAPQPVTEPQPQNGHIKEDDRDLWLKENLNPLRRGF